MSNEISIKDEARNLLSLLLVQHRVDTEEYALLMDALAQSPLPEPLEYWNAVEGWVKIDEVRKHFDAVNCGTTYKHGGEGRVPLYTSPPQQQAEPVAWDKTSASFDEWWDSDRHDNANPFDTDSFAYWAWEGWQAALRSKNK